MKLERKTIFLLTATNEAFTRPYFVTDNDKNKVDEVLPYIIDSIKEIIVEDVNENENYIDSFIASEFGEMLDGCVDGGESYRQHITKDDVKVIHYHDNTYKLYYKSNDVNVSYILSIHKDIIHL